MQQNLEVVFNPFPKQIEFLEAVFSGNYTVIMYGGAIRGGKTFAGIGALLLLCKKYPLSRWAIVRTDLQTLKRNTIPSFWKCCPTSFIKSYNQDTQTVTFTNGSQILFFSENYADDKELNRWKGLEVSGFLLEEINEQQYKSFNKAIERAGSLVIPNKPKPLIMATCNPTNNWVKEVFYDPYKNGTLPDKWLYIPSKIFDNPFVTCDSEYMESLKSMPRYEYEVFVNGDWDLQQKSGAEFYKEFNADKHIEDIKYNPELPIWLSIDENVHPYFSCTIWQLEGKEARQIDELCMRNPNNTIKGLCGAIIDRYSKHEAGMLITGDATSKKEDVKVEKGFNLFSLIKNELAMFNPQVIVPSSNPSVYVRGQFINTILFSNFKDIKIIINSSCKETIRDVINVKQDSDGTKFKKKVTDASSGVRYEEYGHLSDCLDYLITTVFKNEFLEYQGKSSIPTFSGGHESEIKTNRF